ncbi:MAG: hypothetical protein FWH02_02250 [Oscillospiraceae bacterium]|nr:hypothetical protein [Oscillospiraceae bacterium]
MKNTAVNLLKYFALLIPFFFPDVFLDYALIPIIRAVYSFFGPVPASGQILASSRLVVFFLLALYSIAAPGIVLFMARRYFLKSNTDKTAAAEKKPVSVYISAGIFLAAVFSVTYCLYLHGHTTRGQSGYFGTAMALLLLARILLPVCGFAAVCYYVKRRAVPGIRLLQMHFALITGFCVYRYCLMLIDLGSDINIYLITILPPVLVFLAVNVLWMAFRPFPKT